MSTAPGFRGPLYGQVVAGPPGSGKTTYCTGMQEYLRLLGRNAWVINLDPANEVPKSNKNNNNTTTTTTSSRDDIDKDNNATTNNLPYDTLLDVCECVVNLSSVMQQLGLGPNGGLVYCMEYLEAHVSEIVAMIQEQVQQHVASNSSNHKDRPYLIFDLPGQVELYTHGMAVPKLLEQLVKLLDLRLVAVQLIDAHYCTEPANFLSAALLGTTTMLRLELPTVSVLSKIDLLANYGPLPFALDYFIHCQDLDRLVPFLTQQLDGDHGWDDNDNNDDVYKIDDNDDEFDFANDPDYQKARRTTRSSPFFQKHEKMHRVLAEVVEEFGLLSFLPLDISSAESVGHVVARIDKCNGYLFVDQTKGSSSSSSTPQDLFQCAVQSSEVGSNYETIADIQERLSDARISRRNQTTTNTKSTISSSSSSSSSNQ